MNLQSSKQNCRALTLFEVLVVIAIIAVLVAMLMPAITTEKRKADRIRCISYLKQIGLAERVWEGDHTNLYPPLVSVTNGGIMELSSSGSRVVLQNFLAMTNELASPVILHCPADNNTSEAKNFSKLSNSNISYFINLDAADSFPDMILSGDANLMVNGTNVHSGTLNISTNDKLSWTGDRHRFAGNIGLADGSVQQVTISGLQKAFHQTGLASNRIVLP